MGVHAQFNKEAKPALQAALAKKNIHQAPSIDKVIISVGIGSLATRKGVKDFSDIEKNIIKITGQKPSLIKSKRAISNFKLREDMPSMFKVTLRRDRALEFLTKLNAIVLPRVRDFVGLNPKSFDPQFNFNIGLTTQGIFPELQTDDAGASMGMQITIVTHAETKADAQALFQKLGFVFIEK
jgi:large subunit ribosomal protein L5